jgi:hypothetical protein
MDADLSPIVAALADLSDADLRALIRCTCKAPQLAPGFMAWLDTACDWEERRCRDARFRLAPPESAIPPEEDAMSIAGAVVLRQRFADMPAAAALFGAIADVLAGAGVKRH